MDDHLAVFDAQGALLEQHSVHDLLEGAPLRWAPLPVPTGGGPQADRYHCNSFVLLEGEPPARGDARFAAGRALVSIRNQNQVGLFDLEAGQLVWAWGRGELELQHEATRLSTGNVLIFDNGGLERPWSRVIEVDPASDSIVWEYVADPPQSFFSKTRGVAQELPNGNVLVSDSNAGRAFEIARTGEIVWAFAHPPAARNGRRSALRLRAYPLDDFEAGSDADDAR